MDQIKQAFSKVKEDMDSLNKEIREIKKELSEIQISILNLTKSMEKTTKNTQIMASTQKTINKTENAQNSTDNTSSTDTSTHILPFQSLKIPNMKSSIGNDRVSTDRQTIRQTDKTPKIQEKTLKKPTPDPSIVLDQLDDLKKDLMVKIKKLTNQEMLVFSSLYQLEEQGETVDYELLSAKLNLSESSIRDYIQRSILKGMPINKEKINNKKIILHISNNFKKLATLNTLLELREL